MQRWQPWYISVIAEKIILGIGYEEAVSSNSSVFKGFSLELDWVGPQIKCTHGALNQLHLQIPEGGGESYLYSHHRKHLHRYPVKLVKAAPSSCLSQAFVDVPTGLWTQRDKYSDALGQEASQIQIQSDW